MAPMAKPAMVIASIKANGSSSMITRSLNVPGSDSSALQIRYRVTSAAPATASHFTPAGNAAPPRPRKLAALTSATTEPGPISNAAARAS